MLTTSQIIKIFSKSKKKEFLPNTEDILGIMKYVNIDSGIMDNGIDYYFKINIFELSKSGISDETIFEMAKNGWVLSKNRKYIECFC